ncbi:hypothetical protein F383_36591 [Gossypium arboreum]|uniref:Uncharacterized protein n=1 Tax=Gossypium arboreum TaxID=29729 RepID=A0A0B0M600_GOSAR|nr:hypothetical protein F383_36591 [Gossypium arboreum]
MRPINLEHVVACT